MLQITDRGDREEPIAAQGIWSMEDRLWFTGEDGVEQSLHGFGFYHERYALHDDEWLISYRRLERLRVDVTPGFYRGLRG